MEALQPHFEHLWSSLQFATQSAKQPAQVRPLAIHQKLLD